MIDYQGAKKSIVIGGRAGIQIPRAAVKYLLLDRFAALGGAYYSLDEAGGARADRLGANNLTDPTTAGSVAGKAGLAATFLSASSQYLLCAGPTAVLHPGQTSFTVWGWVWDTTAAAHGYMGAWDANKQEWAAWNDGARWAFALSSTGANATSLQYTLFAPTTGAWHFLVFQRDFTNGKVIITANNGQRLSQNYVAAVFQSDGGMRLGAVDGAAYHNGRLDEVGFIGGLLTPAEQSVLWNYGAGLAWPHVCDRHPLVVFDGDSIVAGYGVATQAGAMPQQFETLCGTAYHVVNMGETGKRVTTMLTDAAARIDSQYDAGLFAKNIVVFQAGTNDLYDSAVGLYNNIVAWCAARRLVGWKVVVSTVLPRKDVGLRADFEADRQTLNTSIRANWATFADALSDIGGDATVGQADSPDNGTYYQADKLHTAAAANAIIAGYHQAAVAGL